MIEENRHQFFEIHVSPDRRVGRVIEVVARNIWHREILGSAVLILDCRQIILLSATEPAQGKKAGYDTMTPITAGSKKGEILRKEPL